MKTLDYILLTLVIIGAINWGLIGFLQFDLVRVLFGDMSLLSRIIYAAVGIGGLYAISYYGRIRSQSLGQGNYYSSLLAEITMLWLQNA